MQLSLPVAVLALLGAAEAAPHILIRVKPGFFASETTVVHADGSRTNIGYTINGCKSNISGMKQVCVDSGKKRAHVIYDSGYKRCFRQSRTWGTPGCLECMNFEFSQATCNW